MRVPGLKLELQPLPTPLPMWHGDVDAPAWLNAAKNIAQAGGRLLALWGVAQTPASVCAAYVMPTGLLWLELELADGQSHYPDLVPLFPVASRMQRATADLCGLRAKDAQDQRPWLNHGAWSSDYFPLSQQTLQAATTTSAAKLQNYAFVPVEGDGVHEIAVGPVHAGIIEPGHFRFSVVGEKVMRLEQRLGYTHKGIELRMTQLQPMQAHRLAGRVSGDSTVAYAWAYCMALEAAAGAEIPARASSLRALLLERERIANHLGDLGALGNDAAFAFGLAQFSRLREDWLRCSKEVFGHRLMMDCITPGGVVVDVTPQQRALLQQQCDAIEPEVNRLRIIYEAHAGVQDRFLTAGRVTPALAAQLGMCGLAGRASAQAFDLRCEHPLPPYDQLKVTMASHAGGDIAARISVRFDEVTESLRLVRGILAALPTGTTRHRFLLPEHGTRGAGWVEGWRGQIFVALELNPASSAQRIRRCHLHDPSWQNWPLLEHAIMNNIVPDFPLINKSFNLSYSGADL